MILPMCFMGKFGGSWCLEQSATLRPPGLHLPLGWRGPLCLVSLTLSCFSFPVTLSVAYFCLGPSPRPKGLWS